MMIASQLTISCVYTSLSYFFFFIIRYPPVKKFETFSAGNEASWGLAKNMLEYVNELL